MLAELATYQAIVVNSSAGKDSQAMLDYVVEQATAAHVRDRLVVLHCDLGLSPGGEPIEWPGTKELAEEHAKHYGLRFIIAKRGIRGFLEEVADRGAWPSNSERYCTSYFKRDQGQKVLTALAQEARGFLEQIEYRGKWPANAQRYCTSKFKQQPGATALVHLANEARSQDRPRPRLLNCYGFRAEESPRRRKLPAFAENKRASNSRKYVADWLPIHAWTTAQVWERIQAAGTRHHPAYDQGMTRLSCRFCIFAPKSQLMVSAKLNPDLFAEYVAIEKKMGHTFRKDLALGDVQKAIEEGEQPVTDDGCWNM
jgi:3'-phosphoadenosine 5'-phosphosulfate sulfotransferase (PAPS reductase)/FAD synthetase